MIVEIDKGNINLINELALTFSTFFLSSNNILEDFSINIFSKYFIYMEKSNIIGFINYYDLYDRFEIANICVLYEFRNKGIATKMLEHLIKIGKEKEINNITLEVKIDNEIAIKLYKKFDFVIVAKRDRYYDGIDGLLMERKMM